MHRGSCHCGAISFSVEGDFEQVMECNCSHCSRKGYLLWQVERDKVAVNAGDAAISTYRFNRHVIEHCFCGNCGCAPFGFGTAPDGRQLAAINIRCLEGVNLSSVKRVPVDGRSF